MKHLHTSEDKDTQECCSVADTNVNQYGRLQMFAPSIASFVILMVALIFDNYYQQPWFSGVVRILWYVVAYLLVGFLVLKDAVRAMAKGEIFSEFTLMSIATIGAFSINQYPEAVSVMLFYSVGEIFQTLAVRSAKGNIKALLDQRPETVTILVNDKATTLRAENAKIGTIIQVRAGEKLGLDGVLISDIASFNTVALTGESRPATKRRGETVLAGMINLNTVVQVQVMAAFKDSKLSRIIKMVEEATARKAPTELFIRKFAKVYTPVVVFFALCIFLLPMLFLSNYIFQDWLYRALIFLVISCPCALVISIPLGYFGGIGAASKNGILVKGSAFLDIMAAVQVVVLDKTGTLTKGIFKVQEVVSVGYAKETLVKFVAAMESRSTHPVGKAIVEYANDLNNDVRVTDIEEIAGHGLKANVSGLDILAGNTKLLRKFGIEYDTKLDLNPHTIIVVAIENKYAGYFLIGDEIKDDAKQAIQNLHNANIRTVLLSGDKQAVVMAVAKELQIDEAYGDLLPEDKVAKLKHMKKQGLRIAFVGDGVNDAPVIALADAGIAMGGLGSDATIETADIVIQNDQPSKIFTAINIGKRTKQIVLQNIVFAMSAKVLFLFLGAMGVATLWEAVFADVGVAILAILNAVRMKNAYSFTAKAKRR